MFGNYIAGAWVPAASGKTFENRNPADTSELVGLFADSGPEDVQKAVSAARSAYPKWKALPAPKRGEILYRAGEILLRRKEDFS
ncbi:MAG: aldehyde dehydrogenase family protein, partial [Candidatus Methylomirabilales bacterium]